MSHFQGAINFIGGYVIESALYRLRGIRLHPTGRLPALPCSLQERQGSHHVGPRESKRVLDGTVNVRFSGQMDDSVHFFTVHESAHTFEIADVHLHETIIRTILHVLQISGIAGIREFVEIDYPVFRIFPDKQAHDMGTDESGPSGDDNCPPELTFHIHCISIHFLNTALPNNRKAIPHP